MIEFFVKIGVPEQFAGDVWLLVIFLAVSLVLILLVKQKNLGAVLISVYTAYAILTKAFFDFLDNQNFKLAVFFGLVFFLFQVFQRFFKMGIGGGKVVMWAKVVAVSLSIVGLLASIAMQWFSVSAVREFFSPMSAKLFLSEQAQLAWMLVPLVFIFLVVQKKY